MNIAPRPGACQFCFPIPFSIPGTTAPGDIDNGTGDVIVTIRQHREEGADVGFWTMKYPDEIRSQATARYTGADVGLWPSADGFAELVDVL